METKLPCIDCLMIPLCKQKINIENKTYTNFDYTIIALSQLKCSLVTEFVRSKSPAYIYNGFCDVNKVDQILDYLRER